jgi:hypothetical protein
MNYHLARLQDFKTASYTALLKEHLCNISKVEPSRGLKKQRIVPFIKCLPMYRGGKGFLN